MSDVPPRANRYLERPEPSSLADVIDTSLDKGLVCDASVQVSPVRVEVATGDARAVMTSLDTYLRLAEAANRIVLGRSWRQRALGINR